MKNKTARFLFLAALLFICVFQLTGCQTSKNTTPLVQESWETISNRWGSVSLEKIIQTAEQGDVTAQYYLACAYKDGNGISKDGVESFKWVKLAAQQGLVRAQRNLGRDYEDGFGVETNLSEAVVWYQKAAQQGDAQAQFNLGWLYDNGNSGSQDYAEAAKFYRLAAEQGHAMAQNNLGWLYKNGWGVPDNQVEAVKWFQKSAEQGEKLGAENLAWMYAAGEYGASNTFGQGAEAQIRSGGVAPNHELAERWMRQAVDLNSAEGQCQFGDLLYGEFDNEGYWDTTRFSDAAEWFRKAAEQGYAEAQYKLAEMYNAGKLGDDQRTNCIPWFLKAAANGNDDAKAEIGRLRSYYPDNELLKGIDVIGTLREAAENGNLEAQYQLARRYQIGNGVPKDLSEAFEWMQKATEHDVTQGGVVCDARYCLGVMYERGEGVHQDITNAWRYYQEAAISAFWNVNAALRVAQMHENGEGVPQNDRLAIVFYYMATVHGGEVGCESIEDLFRLYANDRGLLKTNQAPRDYDGGILGDVYEKQLNSVPVLVKVYQSLIMTPKAQFYVGVIYYQGKLVPQDLVEAAAWFRLAANQNLDEARQMLNQIQLEMSPAQKEAAKSRYDLLEEKFKRAKEEKAIRERDKQNFPELFLD